MKTYSNETTEVYATDSFDRVQIGIHETSVPNSKARYAMDVARIIAVPMMLDAHPNAKTHTASDVSKTACDLADAMYADIKARGWTVTVPGMEQIAAEARENRGKN